MAVTIDDVRNLLPMEQLEDLIVLPHLHRAEMDYADVAWPSDEIEKEAVASKAIYYVAPMLWLRIQQHANEYDESLETFRDVKTFQSYWLDRSRTATELGTSASGTALQWGEV